jgi:hypothetical protein
MTTADDRARLERIRHDHLYDVDLGRWDDDETWLLRMAEDGLDARDRIAAALALCDEADEAHARYLEGPILDRFIVPSNVRTDRLRAALTSSTEALVAWGAGRVGSEGPLAASPSPPS